MVVSPAPCDHETEDTMPVPNPTFGAHTAQVVERARERDVVAETYFSVEPFTLYELVCHWSHRLT